MVEFMPYVICSLAFGGILVKCHNVHNRLRVALLIHRSNPVLAEYSLPFSWKPLLAVSTKLFKLPIRGLVTIQSIVTNNRRVQIGVDLSVFDLR